MSKTVIYKRKGILSHIDTLISTGEQLKSENIKYVDNCTPHIKGKKKYGKE